MNSIIKTEDMKYAVAVLVKKREDILKQEEDDYGSCQNINLCKYGIYFCIK